MEKQKETKNNNSRLSLYPLKFEEAVKDLLKAKPQDKAAKPGGGING